jgi:hypothetical protein
MNNEFSKWYLALLRKQVEEEIQFLVTNRHDSAMITTPCMFCVESGKGWYRCARMQELKRFLSSIVSHGSSKLRVEHERKKIGYELPQHPSSQALQSQLNHSDLPLLSREI